ncbi:MAG TPA: tetratricopeptide repeat protein [Steroidobacteraceae bacterium]|nr:tetratricopeptide repeat protein [Steroidobacteraceae bacterium]
MLFVGGARAAGGDAQATFTEARSAFEAGDFSRALFLYERCLVLGMQGPAVHYNIGVAAYRAGDLARAESAFHEVARTPAMTALAHYNLALVAQKRGDEKTARQWLEQVSRQTSDDKLASLAQSRLDGLQKVSTGAAWSLYARSGVGFDGNVALRSDSIDTAGSGQDDAFGELMLAGSYSFRPSWRLDGAMGLLRYAELDEFNQSALSFGVVHGMTLDAWRLEPGVYLSQFSLGGDVYERSAAASVEASRALAGAGWLRAQLRISSVDGEGDFSGLSGSRSEIGLRYEWEGQQSLRFGALARAEFNDSEDTVFESRWVEIGADARWVFSPQWTFVAIATLRQTRHPTQPEVQDAWDDERTAIRLEAIRLLWSRAQLFVRYEHERNQSPIEENDYDRDWVAASIEIWR